MSTAINNTGKSANLAKTMELFLVIGGAEAQDTWASADEASAIIEQWLEEARSGDYPAEIFQIEHSEKCYEQQFSALWGEDHGDAECCCAQYSTDHHPVAEHQPAE